MQAISFFILYRVVISIVHIIVFVGIITFLNSLNNYYINNCQLVFAELNVKKVCSNVAAY